MSACSVSRLARALGALALLVAVTGVAHARVVVNGVTLGDSSDRTHVRVSSHGVTVTTGAEDSALRLADTLGHGAIVVDDGAGMVRFLSDADVRPGDRLDGDVVAIFGNVHVHANVSGAAVAIFGHVDIDPGVVVSGDAVSIVGGQRSAGTVSGDEVTVLGSTELAPGAQVGGDAVAVGGRVTEADSTHVGGQVVSFAMLPLTLGIPWLALMLGMIVIGWLANLFFGWLFVLLTPERLVRVAVTSSRRTFFSILLALLSFLLMPMVSILMICTIIGAIPGVFLWFAYPVAMYAGQLAATHVLGSKLLRRRLDAPPTLAPIAVGSLLIAFFEICGTLSFTLGGPGAAVALFFWSVALLVLTGLGAIGGGAFLLSRAGGTPTDVGGTAPAAAPAPPSAA